MDLTLAAPSHVEIVAPHSDVRVDFLDDWRSIELLESEWNHLLRQSASDSIFLTWDWIRSWAAVMRDVRPLVVCVRDARGDLAGVAPFYQATMRLSHSIPYRVLRVMADYPTGADYTDWVLRRSDDQAVTMAIVKALRARRGWDLIWMPGMAGWTGSFERIVTASRACGLYCQTREQSFAYVALPPERDAYFRALSKNKKQQLRAEMKRIGDLPGLDVCRCDTEEQIPEFLEALFALHSRRWNEKGDTGTFKSRPQEVEFFRHFVPVALRNGWLRLFGLRVNGELKAVQIGYVYRNVFNQLQEGFDPEFIKGVGNVLRAKVIEQCIDEGLDGYDFLGDMTEHKRRWLGVERTGHDLLIGRSKLKNLLLFKGGVWPSGRFMRQVSPPLDDVQ